MISKKPRVPRINTVTPYDLSAARNSLPVIIVDTVPKKRHQNLVCEVAPTFQDPNEADALASRAEVPPPVVVEYIQRSRAQAVLVQV